MTEKNQWIELIYDENIVLAAEQLYENKAVIDLGKTLSNLYIGKVRDGKEYEIEIQSPFAKKQKMSCDCIFFKNNRICKHVVAGLFYIRTNLKSSQQPKKIHSADSQPKKFSSLNSTIILEEVSHEDLVAFVKMYAKTDKKFSTQLKVTFARKVDLTDNADKYKSILHSIIRPNTGQESRAGSSEVKALIQVLEDFRDQINDSIALGQFREAYNIFSNSFSKLEYVRHHYNYHSDQLQTLSHNYHNIISYFLAQKLPQELKSDLLAFILDLASRSYYHYTDISNNVIAIIYKEFKLTEKNKLVNLLQDLMDKRSAKEISYLLALLCIVNGKHTTKVDTYFKQYSLNTIEICDLLVSAGHDYLALNILESHYKRDKHVKDVVNRLVFLYARFGDLEKMIETATIAYFKSGDYRYVEVLKKELDKDTYQNTIAKIETRLLSEDQDPDLILGIYKKEENWQAILDYISGTGSLDLLKKHDTILYKHEPNALIMLYLYMIKTYLDQYMGDMAIQYMESLKNHLSTQKMDVMIEKIRSLLKDKYYDRPKLIELFEA